MGHNRTIYVIFIILVLLSNGVQASECMQINKIEVDDKLQLFRISHLVELYEGVCFKSEDLQEFISSLSNILIDAGYTTSRPQLPKQNLKSGILKVAINYSKIDKITIKENGRISDRNRNALGVEEREIFNMHAIDESIDNINRLNGSSVTAEIAPSSTLGMSDVIFNESFARRYGGSLSYDNTGSTSNGKNLLNGSVYYNDFFKLHEAFSITFREGWNDKMRRVLSNHVGATLSVPYRYWLLTLSTNYFEYDKKIATPRMESTRYSGLSFNHSVELEKLLIRNQYGKTSAGILLSTKDSSNFVERTQIDVSSRKMDVGSFKVTQLLKIDDSVITGTLKFTKSLNKPKYFHNFHYWTFDLNLRKPFEIRQNRLIATSTFSSQLSNVSLLDTEAFSVGGAHSVRGFRDQGLSGENGYSFHNDLIYPFTMPFVDSAQVYVGYDFGRVSKNWNNKYNQNNISGLAFGLRGQKGYGSLEVAYEKALKRGVLKDEGSMILLRLSFVM